MAERSGFINVDLEVESRQDLAPLVRAMSRVAMDLSNRRARGRNCLTFELHRGPRDAEQGVRRLARAVQRLPPAARRAWNGATRRDFDIGIDAPPARARAVVELSPAAVRLVAGVGGRVVVTVYGPPD